MTEPIAIADIAANLDVLRDGFRRVPVDVHGWCGLAMGCAEGKHDLGAIWLADENICMMLYDATAGIRAIVSLPLSKRTYPSVSRYHAPAMRLERTLRELHDIEPLDLPDTRAWIDHAIWPAAAPDQNSMRRPAAGYTFLPVEGDGLHQIPVGPVHAGIIEPGHFRFTANGEAVVRLEERLGYVHKGVEALCKGAEIAVAARIAARISGDSTVAYSWGFALAVEAALGISPPARALVLRGIMGELERLSHHINDVGAICNDASVVALQARCTLMREEILQIAAECFGHRLMMDCIIPGGVAVDLAPDGAAKIAAMLERLSLEFDAVVKAYDNLPSLQDRTVTTGIVKPEFASRFAAGGYVGRASGRAFDARAAFAYAPYDQFKITSACRNGGDVNARVWVRIDEVRASIGLVRAMLQKLEPGSISMPLAPLHANDGAAMVEAFRGDLFIHLSIGANGKIASFHARDASCFQWPLLEAAIEGNIVADFPLCNKSFNCSYSGHDL